MSAIPAEFEELRVGIERLRTMLENLVVRGLRACGPDELQQLQAHAEHLDQAGAGHLSAVLSELREKIEQDNPASAKQLLEAQTNVRLLDRLLTLRVVALQYAMAIEMSDHPEALKDEADDDDSEE